MFSSFREFEFFNLTQKVGGKKLENVLGLIILWIGCVVVAYILGNLWHETTFKQNVIFSLVVSKIFFVMGAVFFTSGGGTPPSVLYSR